MIALSTYTYSGDGSPAVPEIGDWRHGGDWSVGPQLEPWRSVVHRIRFDVT